MKWTPKNVAIAAGVVLAVGWYLKYQAGETVKDAANAVNPTNQDNIFNRAFESGYSAITGSDDSPGVDMAEWWHGLDEE